MPDETKPKTGTPVRNGLSGWASKTWPVALLLGFTVTSTWALFVWVYEGASKDDVKAAKAAAIQKHTEDLTAVKVATEKERNRLRRAIDDAVKVQRVTQDKMDTKIDKISGRTFEILRLARDRE